MHVNEQLTNALRDFGNKLPEDCHVNLHTVRPRQLQELYRHRNDPACSRVVHTIVGWLHKNVDHRGPCFNCMIKIAAKSIAGFVVVIPEPKDLATMCMPFCMDCDELPPPSMQQRFADLMLATNPTRARRLH